MEINKQRNGQFTTRFIYSLPLEKRFIYNGDKQTEKWAVQNEVYIQSSIGETFIYNGDKQTSDHNEVYTIWGNVLYIMEINKQRNGQYTTRFIFSLPLAKRFIYNGDKQTEKWAVHNEIYIQSSI